MLFRSQTIKNITIAPEDGDSYSLIVSGALAIVDATGLPNGPFHDDRVVTGQIWLQSGSQPPIDPSISGSPDANIIDNGEF